MIEDLQEFQQLPATLPDTQGINSQMLHYSQTLENGWGLLLPVICEGNIRVTVMTEDFYSVGRSPSCSIALTEDKIKSPWFTRISKVHFRLIKASIDDGTNIIYLEDLSSNGTFINGIKVGKNKRVILTSADEISLALPTFKVFMYIDSRNGGELWLTKDLDANFLVLRHLGKGGFGEVKLVINKETFQKYAMKKVEICEERERSIFNEVNILKRLKHPFIIHFEAIYETPKAVFITLEYMSGGNLLQRIRSKKRIPENECKMIFYQLILGVKYLHEEGIVHRDLKAENVLLEMKGENKDILVKITDFGLSKILHSTTNLKTVCGTLRYTAPEIIKVSSGTYDCKVDIWSSGVILYYCLSGELPFITCLTENDLVRAILRGAYEMPFSRWQLVSAAASNLVKQMLKVKPIERISSNAIIHHRWFQDNILKSRIQEMFGDSALSFIESEGNMLDLSHEYNIDAKRIRKE